MTENDHWFQVPRVVATRARGQKLRQQAKAQRCDVLDFSGTEFISAAAADEMVCNGEWTATTGESPDVREVVERAIQRRSP